MKYRKYPNLVRTQVEIISNPNYLVRILWKIIFKAPNLVRTFYFSGYFRFFFHDICYFFVFIPDCIKLHKRII